MSPVLTDKHLTENQAFEILDAADDDLIFPDPAPPISPACIDSHHGRFFSDRFHTLEDVTNPATVRWATAQSEKAEAHLNASSERDEIEGRITEILDRPRRSIPYEIAGDFYYSERFPETELPVFYITTEPFGDPGRVLFDPNAITGVTGVRHMGTSPDGKMSMFALMIGSDTEEIVIVNNATGKLFPDRIKNTIYSNDAAWDPENTGFLYSRFPETEEPTKERGKKINHSLYYHRIGTPQSEDVLVYCNEATPYDVVWTNTSTDQENVFITIKSSSIEFSILEVDFSDSEQPILVPITIEKKARYDFLECIGDKVYFRKTSADAPMGEIVVINTAGHEPEEISLVKEGMKMSFAGIVGERLVCVFSDNGKEQINIYSINGEFERIIELPEIGAVTGLVSFSQKNECYFGFHSIKYPEHIYRLDLDTGEYNLVYEPTYPNSEKEIVTRIVSIERPDGSTFPAILAHREDLERNSENIALEDIYGGFGIPTSRGFLSRPYDFISSGGVYIKPMVRGAGDFGKEGHDAGRMLNKQKTFDDTILAAEWLCKNGYTSPGKIGIFGGSNGALSAVVCAMQRPNLYGAVVASSGLYDMFRYHVLGGGGRWTNEFGTVENETQFHAIAGYSPPHNLVPGTEYPAVLFLVGLNDRTVVPGHTLKFAAAFQAAQAADRPCLLKVNDSGGHSDISKTSRAIEKATDILSFLYSELNR